jgi:hypothetical protein
LSRSEATTLGFEAAILTKYLPQTPVEQELVCRLAALFCRIGGRSSRKLESKGLLTGVVSPAALMNVPPSARPEPRAGHRP